MEFCSCGSIKEFGICSNRYCGRENSEWIIEGVLVQFKEPVTQDRAVELMGRKSSLIIKQPTPIRENRNKQWLKSPSWQQRRNK